jgi:hypothetical protein
MKVTEVLSERRCKSCGLTEETVTGIEVRIDMNEGSGYPPRNLAIVKLDWGLPVVTGFPCGTVWVLDERPL